MERHLRAGNRSPRTIQSYAEAALQFDAWLDDQDLPVDAGLIERRHVEAWLASLLDRWKPATAAARYRSLRQFFRWLEDDGELDVSTMTKMRPPQVLEQPVPVLTDDQLGTLLDASTGKASPPGATPRSSGRCSTRAVGCRRSRGSRWTTSASTSCSTWSARAAADGPCPSVDAPGGARSLPARPRPARPRR